MKIGTCIVVIFAVYQEQRLLDLMSLEVRAHVDVCFCSFPQGPFLRLEAERSQCPAGQPQLLPLQAVRHCYAIMYKLMTCYAQMQLLYPV